MSRVTDESVEAACAVMGAPEYRWPQDYIPKVQEWKREVARTILEAAIPHLAPVSVTNDPRVVELASLLRELLPYVATATLQHCDGNKCREPWCIGCSGEDEAAEAATKAQDASVRAYAALANLEKKE